MVCHQVQRGAPKEQAHIVLTAQQGAGLTQVLPSSLKASTLIWVWMRCSDLLSKAALFNEHCINI